MGLLPTHFLLFLYCFFYCFLLFFFKCSIRFYLFVKVKRFECGSRCLGVSLPHHPSLPPSYSFSLISMQIVCRCLLIQFFNYPPNKCVFVVLSNIFTIKVEIYI